MIIEIIWIIFTLGIATSGVIIARKYGVEYVTILIATFVLMANVFSSKIIDFFGFYVTAGTIVYSSTYFLTDFLSEFYGKKIADRAVWAGLIINVIYIIFLGIVIAWQGAPFWENQPNFELILGLSLRISIASIIFYIIPQLHDTWAYEFWKQKTKGKHMWVRNNASTLVSQLIDTVGFTLTAFYGVLPFETLIGMMISVYIVKVIIAILDTPFLYFAKWFIEKNKM